VKHRHAIVSLSALSLATVALAEPSGNCQYSRTGEIHQQLKLNYDSRFTYEQNFNLAVDKHILQADALTLARCILKHSKSAKTLRNSFGSVRFSPTVYLYPANDYSYGVVGYSHGLSGAIEDSDARHLSGVIAKITFKIGLDGRTQEFDSIATKFSTGQTPKWFRFDGSVFRRQDSQCLECHKKQQRSAYLFLERNFQRLPVP